jgi:hypothetical protein
MCFEMDMEAMEYKLYDVHFIINTGAQVLVNAIKHMMTNLVWHGGEGSWGVAIKQVY